MSMDYALCLVIAQLERERESKKKMDRERGSERNNERGD